jgi:hypothetical protein
MFLSVWKHQLISDCTTKLLLSDGKQYDNSNLCLTGILNRVYYELGVNILIVLILGGSWLSFCVDGMVRSHLCLQAHTQMEKNLWFLIFLDYSLFQRQIFHDMYSTIVAYS